ncbi:hypothetical protein U1Q18_050755 [Sarracenia purpurea var. burkii]
MPSPPIMQKTKRKNLLPIANGRKRKHNQISKYKYPGATPIHPRNTTNAICTTSPIYINNQSSRSATIDKFDKHTLLNAAKAKPGDSVVIDYDMETAHEIPIFDIPSDIDMGSGTFEVSPDGFGNYILEQDETNNDGLKTLPINYYNNYDSYEVLGNPQMNNGQGYVTSLPTGDSQYAMPIGYNNEGTYEIPSNSQMYNGPGSGQIISTDNSQYMLPTSYNNENAYEVLSNPQMNDGQGSGIITPSGDLQYSIEIDRSDTDIPSNPGMIVLTKNYQQSTRHIAMTLIEAIFKS